MKSNLPTVSEYLQKAPGAFLSLLRSKFTQKKGLVQNSKIIDEVNEELLKHERVELWIKKRDAWELLTLKLIYASGCRGVHFRELESALNVDVVELKSFLNETSKEMFIWHVPCQKSFIYYGFSDFLSQFLQNAVQNIEEPANGWFSNENLLEWHLVYIIAEAQLGKLSLKKDECLTHFSTKNLLEKFMRNKNYDRIIYEDEVSLLFAFLLHKKWLHKNPLDGKIKPSQAALDFLQNNGFRLFSDMVHWWEHERFFCRNDLKQILHFFEKPVSPKDALQLLWASDTHVRFINSDSALTWQALPLPLRELWELGILKVSLSKKKITAFCLTDLGHILFFGKTPSANLTEPICGSSSNFEWLLSISNGPFRLFQIACFAGICNNENPLRFSISKESFLAGLHSGLPDSFTEDFFSWNCAKSAVNTALRDWQKIYTDSSIETVQILRIKNTSLIEELVKCKPFMKFVVETIQNFGFLIMQDKEKEVREILRHFSLEPATLISESNYESLSQIKEASGFVLPHPIPETNNAFFYI